MIRFLGSICFIAFWALILNLGQFELEWAPVSQGGSLSAIHYELDPVATDAFIASATELSQTATSAALELVTESGVVEHASQWAQQTAQHVVQEGITAAVQQVSSPGFWQQQWMTASVDGPNAPSDVMSSPSGAMTNTGASAPAVPPLPVEALTG